MQGAATCCKKKLSASDPGPFQCKLQDSAEYLEQSCSSPAVSDIHFSICAAEALCLSILSLPLIISC